MKYIGMQRHSHSDLHPGMSGLNPCWPCQLCPGQKRMNQTKKHVWKGASPLEIRVYLTKFDRWNFWFCFSCSWLLPLTLGQCWSDKIMLIFTLIADVQQILVSTSCCIMLHLSCVAQGAVVTACALQLCDQLLSQMYAWKCACMERFDSWIHTDYFALFLARSHVSPWAVWYLRFLNRTAARYAPRWPSVEAVEVQRWVPQVGKCSNPSVLLLQEWCFQSFQVGLDALQEPPTEPCLILDFKVPFPLQSWLGCIQIVALDNRGRCSTSTHVFCTLRLDDLQNSRSLHTIFDHHSCIHFALRVSQSLWLIVEVPMSGASCTHDVLTEWSIFFIPSGQGGLWLTSVYWICGCLTSLPTIVFMYVSIPHPFFQSACS